MKEHCKWPIIFFTLLIVLLGGCEKEDYTLPVKFNLSFTIKDEPMLGGSLTIDEIGLGLNSISILGYREQGSDVFLTRKFDDGKFFVVKPIPSNAYEKLDIPQGVYNPISFSYNFQPDDDDLIDDILDWLEDFDEGDDLQELQEDLGDIIEDYLEDIKPCIIIKGKFTNSGKTKHIVMVVNDPLTFKILGDNRNGGAEVVLDRGITNTGNLQFNPSYWFSIITPEMLNNAVVGVIDGEEYILLSKHLNSQIYTAIFNRIEVSTTLTINE
jgi:hypothetical protein